MWVSKEPWKPRHYCDKPTLLDLQNDGAGVGSVWQCDVCDKQYRVDYTGNYLVHYEAVN